MKGAIKSNGGQENRSAKDYSDVILKKGYDEKLRKYSDKAKASNVSFVPLILLLDTGKARLMTKNLMMILLLLIRKTMEMLLVMMMMMMLMMMMIKY